MLPDNFSDYPPSITELRSEATGKASEWTPRDALIDVMRGIDDGSLKVEKLVIAFGYQDEHGAECTSHRVVAESQNAALGLLSRIAYRINRLGDVD